MSETGPFYSVDCTNRPALKRAVEMIGSANCRASHSVHALNVLSAGADVAIASKWAGYVVFMKCSVAIFLTSDLAHTPTQPFMKQTRVHLFMSMILGLEIAVLKKKWRGVDSRDRCEQATFHIICSWTLEIDWTMCVSLLDPYDGKSR